MTTARASATLRTGGRAGARSGILRLLVSLATALTLLGLGVVVLLLPMYMHPALDAAGAPAALGLSSSQTHALSDRTVSELVLGPGMFAFAGPDGARFYDESEASHLRDVRTVLYAFLALAVMAAAGTILALVRGRADPAIWRAVARGGAGLAVAVVALGIFALVAFNAAFELFHRVFFPGGNWAFDPASQRLVQLYPLPFWQLTAGAMGVLAVAAGVLVWAFARRRARHLARR
jgi:integral membrane protein (TIGR01906 family)